MHTILAIILLPYVCVCVWTRQRIKHIREFKYMCDEEVFRQTAYWHQLASTRCILVGHHNGKAAYVAQLDGKCDVHIGWTETKMYTNNILFKCLLECSNGLLQ